MPKPISPVIRGLEDREVVFVKDQPHYQPLSALRSADGKVLTRWTMTDEERAAVAAGADIFLTVWTFNQSLQPLLMTITEDEISLAESILGKLIKKQGEG